MAVLTPYEAYYEEIGLVEYESAFKRNTELEMEAAIYQRRLANWQPRFSKDLQVLDIGCGQGTFTLDLLGCLLGRGFQFEGQAEKQQVFLDLVDINPSSRVAYEANCVLATTFSPIVKSFTQVPWQDVLPDSFGGPYDLILANHTFYGTPINSALIEGLLRRLTSKGRLLLALCSQRSDVYQMRLKAGIVINTSELLDEALLQVKCNFSREPYESRIYFSPDEPVVKQWLFASSSSDEQSKHELLCQFRQLDDGRDFIANRCITHVVWRSADVDNGSGKEN